MRPKDFPHSSEFIEKVRLRQEADRRSKVSEQLTTIGKRLEEFGDMCDLDGCLRISESDIGPFGIYEENLKVIGENGWLVGLNIETNQYVFRIKGQTSPNEV
jgi:hypothetical protein